MKIAVFASFAALAAVCGCSTPARKVSRDVTIGRIEASLPTDENERSVWLSWHVNTEETKFQSQTACTWKRDYEVFSQALVEKAERAGFDSSSLAQVLRSIRTDAEAQPLAYIPIAAYASHLNDQEVWIVVVHWELFFGPQDPMPNRPLSHVRTYAFTQRELKQVAFLTCR